jgi:hypothetical protein
VVVAWTWRVVAHVLGAWRDVPVSVVFAAAQIAVTAIILRFLATKLRRAWLHA